MRRKFNGPPKAYSAFFVLLSSLFLILGCSKNVDLKKESLETSDIPAWVLAKLKEEGRSVSVPINKRAAATFLDGNEEERPVDYF